MHMLFILHFQSFKELKLLILKEDIFRFALLNADLSKLFPVKLINIKS